MILVEKENSISSLLKRIKKQSKNLAPNILVVCGGKSFEHDISILSAKIIANAVDDKYNVFIFYQSLDGNLFLVPFDCEPKDFKSEDNLLPVQLKINDNFLYYKNNKKLFKVDLAINCMHGQNCEDGTITHLFDLCNIASSNACATSQALILDKEFMKDIFLANDFNTPNFVVAKNDADFELIKTKLHYPIIVKPANLGSSIGICICENDNELENAFVLAKKFDSKVIFEEFIENAKEVNCAVCDFDGEVKASKIEYPQKKDKFLSFDDKYINNGRQKVKGAKNVNFVEKTTFCHSENNEIIEDDVPQMQLDKLNSLDKKMIEKIQNLSIKLYKTFDCNGIVRIDFLVRGDEIFINELNAIPGSLAYYLWDESIEKFVEKLILSSKRQFDKKVSKSFYFDTHII